MSSPPILNAIQLQKGAHVSRARTGSFSQPLQMLPRVEKDADWCASNMDWHEMLGLRQIKRNAPRLLKNYKLAAGIIDKSDYIPVQADNDQAELVDLLTREDEGAYELKFFPIIPGIVNVLVGEFEKRTSKISFFSTDDISYQEELAAKYQMVEQVLLQEAEQKQAALLQGQGADLEDPEVQKMLAPDQLKTLPEIEQFFQKDYKSQYEQWAWHQYQADSERFHMQELESQGFRDSLIADRAFFAFEMGEDDYRVTLWNTLFTFYHKSPEVPYVSDGNFVGKMEALTVADAIDKLGWEMTQDQLERLQGWYPNASLRYAEVGLQNDGAFYDPSQSYEWNSTGPSLAMRQYLSVHGNDWMGGDDDILAQILGQSEDGANGTREMVRVTTLFWKSQRKLGHLSYVDVDGSLVDLIVDESFATTTRPIYDNSLLKGKSRETLIAGQHVEWFWINETWKGKKVTCLGPSYRPSQTGDKTQEEYEPIYLGVEPLPFQFKGDQELYGCKLPVEGRVFSDRNVRSSSLVDKLKPYQVGYNMVNNQIADILIDELGTVIVLDQNALPKSSLGDDWSSNGGNLGQAHLAMRTYQMLALDTTVQNTEAPLNFQHYQALNLEQSARLMSRVQLASFFKQQAYEALGINQQRAGAVNSQQSGTALEQTVNLSYTQTEPYFTQFADYLMPRVHQQRTDLAQYYQSRKPSVRLTYVTSKDEKVNFQLNGTDLLGRDIGVTCTTKINSRELLEKVRQMALENTSQESIFDRARILKAGSQAELETVLKNIQQAGENQRQQEQEQAQALQQQIEDAATQRQREAQDHELLLQQNELENNIEVAEIKGLGFQTDTADQDAYAQGLRDLETVRNNSEARQLKRDELAQKQTEHRENLQVARERIAQQRQASKDAVTVARTNKNKFDKPKPAAKKK